MQDMKNCPVEVLRQLGAVHCSTNCALCSGHVANDKGRVDWGSKDEMMGLARTAEVLICGMEFRS